MRTPARLLAACLVLAGLGLLLDAPVARAGWWDDLDRGESVELEDVIVHPEHYKGHLVSFYCVFHRVDQVFAPLQAPFTEEGYRNFAVWQDGAAVWEKRAYKDDYPFLYLAVAHPQQAQLLTLEPFTRLEVTGLLRGAIRARPCVEVVSFRPTGERLGKVVVESIMRGDRLAELGERKLAYESYRRALRPDLPRVYDLLIRKRVAESLRRLGRDDDAQAVERGPILGGSSAPEEQPRPAGGLLGDPLPGVSPASAPGGSPPALPGTPDAAPVPGSPPAPLTRDLPGTPAGTGPLTQDLPGTPVDAQPGSTPPASSPAAPPASEPGPRTAGESNPPPATQPAPTSGPALPPGAPPRRVPRLSGVK